MSSAQWTAFRPEVNVRELEDQSTISISLDAQTLSIRPASPGLRHAIRRLAESGAEPAQLEQMVCAHDGIGGLAVWYYWQHQFQAHNLLCYPLVIGGVPAATLFSASAEPVSSPPALQPTDVCVLSRFALCRLAPQGGSLLFETPLSPLSLLLHDPSALSLVGALSTPRKVQELTSAGGEAAEQLLAWFAAASLIDVQDSDPALDYWEFHDLLFHSRSRMGRATARFGATYRFGKESQPCPVVKADMPGEVYPLHRPDPDRLLAESPPFDAVLANRRSSREFDEEHPLTLKQAGEFLYRAARVQQLLPQELSQRPYPAGGALYELEIYLIVRHSADLPRGMYHYNPLQHQLCKLMDHGPELEAFMQASSRAAQRSQAQALLLITSRHARLSWKYESIAYATTLKNLGALYQTLYLVAASMGLGGTAIGCGDADRFARLTGIDYYEEALVGEFLLGTSGERNGQPQRATVTGR